MNEKEHNEYLLNLYKTDPELFKEKMKDKKWRMENLYYILTTRGNLKDNDGNYILDENGEKIKLKGKALLKLNNAQKYLFEIVKKFPILDVLKSRQQGVTTYWAIYFLDEIIFNKNKSAAMINYTKELAQDVFQKKALFALDNIPECIKPILPEIRRTNTKIIVKFKDGSQSSFQVLVNTRGGTYDMTHISELPKMEEIMPAKASDIASGTISSLPPGAILVSESTARGATGLFYDSYKKGEKLKKEIEKSPYLAKTVAYPVFLSWTLDEDILSEVKEEDYIPVEKMINGEINWKQYQIDNDLSDRDITWYYSKWLTMGMDEKLSELQREYPTHADEAFIASGQCMFSLKKIATLKENSIPPLKRYLVEDTLEESPYGELYVYEEPIKGVSYILAADTSFGVSGGDYSVVSVVNERTGLPVAFYRVLMAPEDFAEAILTIANYYNRALVVVENNQSGIVVNDRLYNIHKYTNIYQQIQYDDVERRTTTKMGWDTNKNTRSKALSNYRDAFSKSDFRVYYPYLLEEMETFVYKAAKSKFEALGNKHDDCVMSIAIAYGAKDSYYVKKQSDEKKKDYSYMAAVFGEISIEEYIKHQNSVDRTNNSA